MSQDSVYTFLKRHKTKKYTSREISRWLGIGTGSVVSNIRRLKSRGDIRISGSGKQIYYFVR